MKELGEIEYLRPLLLFDDLAQPIVIDLSMNLRVRVALKCCLILVNAQKLLLKFLKRKMNLPESVYQPL